MGLGVREWRAGFPDAADAAGALRSGRARGTAAARGVGAGTGAGRAIPDAPARVGPPAHAPPPARRPALPIGARSTSIAPTRPSWRALPGVGPGLAQRIVEERERRGRFDSPEALRYVLGMGPKKLAAIRRFITVRD